MKGEARSALPLLLLAATAAPALDLRQGWRHLEELRFERAGEPVGPGLQTFVLAPAPGPGTDWPSRLAEAERARAARAGRQARVWAGMLGGFPAWGVDREVALGTRPARIRRQLVLYALAPGGLLLTARAEDPGGRGRRRVEVRAAALLGELERLASGTSADPFRELRHGPDAGRWRETYRFRVPGGPAGPTPPRGAAGAPPGGPGGAAPPAGLTVELSGPADPELPPPPEPVEKTLFGVYRFLGSGPGSPAPFFRGRVPGYRVEFLPTWPDPGQRSWLARLLGVSHGVGFREPGPGGAGEDPPRTEAPPGPRKDELEALDELEEELGDP